MNPYQISIVSCVLLAIGIVGCACLGHRAGRLRRGLLASDGELHTGTIDAAVFSLLGLLIAFTFASAYSRYESRRQLIVDETNAIGTAYLRLDLLPADIRTALRERFREYTEGRFAMWEKLPEREAALGVYTTSRSLQSEIWTAAVQATEAETGGDARKLLLPALNSMIDITTTRLVAVQSHPPLLIYVLEALLALAAGWITGFGMAQARRPGYLHIVGFAIATSLAIFVILDIEYPHFGFVRLDEANQLLADLARTM